MCTATYLLSLKPSKLDELGMRNSAEEARTNPKVLLSCELFHMDVPVLAVKQELTIAQYGHGM